MSAETPFLPPEVKVGERLPDPPPTWEPGGIVEWRIGERFAHLHRETIPDEFDPAELDRVWNQSGTAYLPPLADHANGWVENPVAK